MSVPGLASPTTVDQLCSQFIDNLHSEDEAQHEQSQGQKVPCFEAMDEEMKEIVRDAVKEEIGVKSIILNTTGQWLAYL